MVNMLYLICNTNLTKYEVNDMKKVFALFIFSALVMNSLAACGDTDKQTTGESTDSLVENVSESTEKLKSNRREADFVTTFSESLRATIQIRLGA